MTIIRFVPTYINAQEQRTLMCPMQGRHTFATEAEAQAWIDAVTRNNDDDRLRMIYGDDPRFEVRACPCGPEHFDPKTCWFD